MKQVPKNWLGGASTMRPVCRMWHVVLQLFYTEYCSINVTIKYIKNYNITIQNTLKIKSSSLRSILDDLFWKTEASMWRAHWIILDVNSSNATSITIVFIQINLLSKAASKFLPFQLPFEKIFVTTSWPKEIKLNVYQTFRRCSGRPINVI